MSKKAGSLSSIPVIFPAKSFTPVTAKLTSTNPVIKLSGVASLPNSVIYCPIIGRVDGSILDDSRSCNWQLFKFGSKNTSF